MSAAGLQSLRAATAYTCVSGALEFIFHVQPLFFLSMSLYSSHVSIMFKRVGLWWEGECYQAAFSCTEC